MHRSLIVAISAALLIVFVGINAANASGILDTAFGTDGKVTTGIGTSTDVANVVALQSDNKIILAGSSIIGSNDDFALARYNTDGSLDTSFGTDGKITTAIGSDNDVIRSMAIQSDGKIVVVGHLIVGTQFDFALARYNSNGSLDTSFNTSGKVSTPIGSANNSAFSMAIQGDGKIVAAGFAYNGSNDDFALARYNTDGSLDTSFGTDGKVITAIGPGNEAIRTLAIQSDGKIVAAGNSSNGSNFDFAITRYNTDGSLDTSFDTDGKLITPIGTSTDWIISIAIQSDGKIVAAGFAYNGSNDDFALARYNTDGSLDTSFGTDGKVITAIGPGNEAIRTVAIQGDGKIVVAGFAYSGSSDDFAIARYNTDGSLDTSFNSDGKYTTEIGSGNDVANSLVIQSDGKIVAAGYSWNGFNRDFAMLRLTIPQVVQQDNSAAQARDAAVKREAERRVARDEILEKFKKSENVSIDFFVRAEIAGITKENIEAVQAELSAISDESRESLLPILKIARKYEVVGLVASDRVEAVYSNSLIEIGLIPADSKHKAALTEAIKNLPVDERSSYAAIKEAIDAEMAEIQARKDRLTAILALIAYRRAS